MTISAAVQNDRVEAVLKELNSGYGDVMSATAPYKSICGVALMNNYYDAETREMFANIDISADQQSPWGDNATTKQSFTLSLSDLWVLASCAPKFASQFDAMAGSLQDLAATRAAQLAQNIQDIVRQEGKLQRPITLMKPIVLKRK